MAVPELAGRKDCVVRVAFDPLLPTAFINWCGAKNFSIDVANQFGEEQVGDCDDWSLPATTVIIPAGQTITASMDATFSTANHKLLSDWTFDVLLLPVQLFFPNCAVGEYEYYDGTAYSETLAVSNIGNTEAGSVTENVSLKFSGTFTRTAKAA